MKDIHNSWLYCFTNPPELGTRVSLSHRQPNVKQYNQELCISLITICFTKRLQSRPLNKFEDYTTLGYIFNYKMFHQEASIETIKTKQQIFIQYMFDQHILHACHNQNNIFVYLELLFCIWSRVVNIILTKVFTKNKQNLR